VSRGGAARLARALRSRLRAGADAGMTLMELVVAMSVMSIFMTMFSAGVVQMFRAANKSESASTAQSQVNLAFLRLDKEIRYAAGLSAPGPVGSDPYVEYLTTNTGSPVCSELRLHLATRQLQRRTWPQGSGTAPTAWIPLASDVSSAQPFTVSGADATYNFQRLQLRLAASAGAGGSATTKWTDVTFTALNTSLGTSSATICTEGRAMP
jgi:prepilin-type N-terminal cleavage/methylation domain-containing protein